MFSFKFKIGRTHSREELMADAQWLLLLFGALQIQLSLVIAILAHGFIYDSIIFAAIGAIFIGLSLIRFYWVRFFMMLLWTGALVLDFQLRHNLFSILFIWFGILMIYRMLRFRKVTTP